MFIEDSPGLPLNETDNMASEETAECPPTPEDVSNCMPDSPVAPERGDEDQITAVSDVPEQAAEDIDKRCVISTRV